MDAPGRSRKLPEEGVYERPQAVLAALYMLTRAGVLGWGALAGNDRLEHVHGSGGSWTGASGGDDRLEHPHQSWGSWTKGIRRCWLLCTRPQERGFLFEGRKAVLAALYVSTGDGVRVRRASGGVGCLVHIHRRQGSYSKGVRRCWLPCTRPQETGFLFEGRQVVLAWDQASGVVVTRPLARVRMPACPASAPEQRDEMTEPGRFFVSDNL